MIQPRRMAKAVESEGKVLVMADVSVRSSAAEDLETLLRDQGAREAWVL